MRSPPPFALAQEYEKSGLACGPDIRTRKAMSKLFMTNQKKEWKQKEYGTYSEADCYQNA